MDLRNVERKQKKKGESIGSHRETKRIYSSQVSSYKEEICVGQFKYPRTHTYECSHSPHSLQKSMWIKREQRFKS